MKTWTPDELEAEFQQAFFPRGGTLLAVECFKLRAHLNEALERIDALEMAIAQRPLIDGNTQLQDAPRRGRPPKAE